ncbi:MAG: thioredoxin domain-containing protein [Actinomycetota bacterium]
MDRKEDRGEGSLTQQNRLAAETSPYLLQHAHNPVAWQPWDDLALQEARKRDVPILLSIGYAACHWCHVMEKESFEDPIVASVMNENFVCIKVDREERPDIDAIYMDAVQAMTGHGGWPMTMFLTPVGHPFYGGTYFPPDDNHGLPAFIKVLRAIAEAWHGGRDELLAQGQSLVERIESLSKVVASSEPLTNSLLSHATSHIADSFDPTHGGFGTAPKFPQAPLLQFVTRMAARDLGRSREMLKVTLDSMAAGGIYDQIGGGFARYSVDPTWLIPHFEKMLYDNALLARVYTQAWQLTKDQSYKRIAEETLNYIIRDLSGKEGCFSSEDADSEGEEGKFYLWDLEELKLHAPEAIDLLGASPHGNFEGTNILTARGGEPDAATKGRLLGVRSKRIRPFRDEKILTSWNGLAISAFAEAGAAFDNENFIGTAEQIATTVLSNARSGKRLAHSFKDGQAKVNGMLEDYAYLAEGLFCLWEATLETRWLNASMELGLQMIELFWDETDGGFFTTSFDHESLILRQKEIVESAMPSPNAVAAHTLLKLSVLTGRTDLRGFAERTLQLAHGYMARAPQATATFLCALDFWLHGATEIAITGPLESASAGAMLRTIRTRFLPDKVIAALTTAGAGSQLISDSPLFIDKIVTDQTTVFVCENYVCLRPARDAGALAELLTEQKAGLAPRS